MKGVNYKRAHELFSYNHETGELRNKITRGPNAQAGELAGCIKNGTGYQQIIYNYKSYKAHRIIWLMVHGRYPDGDIDHINHDRTDNRIENLRVVTRMENCQNHKRSNRSPFLPGVSWHTRDLVWQSYITVFYTRHYLGQSETLLDAACLRKSAEIEYGFHENHGREL